MNLGANPQILTKKDWILEWLHDRHKAFGESVWAKFKPTSSKAIPTLKKNVSMINVCHVCICVCECLCVLTVL